MVFVPATVLPEWLMQVQKRCRPLRWCSVWSQCEVRQEQEQTRLKELMIRQKRKGGILKYFSLHYMKVSQKAIISIQINYLLSVMLSYGLCDLPSISSLHQVESGTKNCWEYLSSINSNSTFFLLFYVALFLYQHFQLLSNASLCK